VYNGVLLLKVLLMLPVLLPLLVVLLLLLPSAVSNRLQLDLRHRTEQKGAAFEIAKTPA
jgi:hypothetical protein